MWNQLATIIKLSFVNLIMITRILTHFKMEIAQVRTPLSKGELQMPLSLAVSSGADIEYKVAYR